MGETQKQLDKNETNKNFVTSTEIQKVLRMYLNKTLSDTLISYRYEIAYCGAINLPKTYLETSVHDFLTLVAYGQQKAVESLLKKFPHLLLESGIITDYSGRKIEGTAYQIALGADDMDMCEMMDKYFALLENGEKEKLKQFNKQFPPEQFPNGFENPPSTYDFRALATAITSNSYLINLPNEATQALINKFRDDFRINPEHIIKTGKHFNIQHLIKAFEINDENYEWGLMQRNVYWKQIIGYLQRSLPACYAQAFCQGLYHVIDKKEPLVRKFDLENGKVFFPLNDNPSSRLGWDFSVYNYDGGGWGWGGERKRLEKLYRAKTADLTNLKTLLHSNNQQNTQNQRIQPQKWRRRSHGCTLF